MKKISIMLILVLVLGGCKFVTPQSIAIDAGKKVVKKTMSKDDSSSEDTQSDSKE